MRRSEWLIVNLSLDSIDQYRLTGETKITFNESRNGEFVFFTEYSLQEEIISFR